MDEDQFGSILKAISDSGLSCQQREALQDAIKRPRGRPKAEPKIGDLLDKYDAAITMRRLQRYALVTYDEAAELAADDHGVKAETLKSWIKRYGLRKMADRHIDNFHEPRRRSFEARQRNSDIMAEADKMGIAYGLDWPISWIRSEVERLRCRK